MIGTVSPLLSHPSVRVVLEVTELLLLLVVEKVHDGLLAHLFILPNKTVKLVHAPRDVFLAEPLHHVLQHLLARLHCLVVVLELQNENHLFVRKHQLEDLVLNQLFIEGFHQLRKVLPFVALAPLERRNHPPDLI